MTLPNQLSLLRILIVPGFLFCLLFDQVFPASGEWVIGGFRTAALILMIGATITDYYDGKLARERNQVSNLGKLLDPLADKLLVCSAFVAFVDLRVYPGWVVVVILFREFLITGLRSLAAVQGRVIHSIRWGKHKTGWQMATIITAITFLAARDFARAAGVWDVPLVRYGFADIIFSSILWILAWICILFTFLSGWLYVTANRDILQEEGVNTQSV